MISTDKLSKPSLRCNSYCCADCAMQLILINYFLFFSFTAILIATFYNCTFSIASDFIAYVTKCTCENLGNFKGKLSPIEFLIISNFFFSSQ